MVWRLHRYILFQANILQILFHDDPSNLIDSWESRFEVMLRFRKRISLKRKLCGLIRMNQPLEFCSIRITIDQAKANLVRIQLHVNVLLISHWSAACSNVFNCNIFPLCYLFLLCSSWYQEIQTIYEIGQSEIRWLFSISVYLLGKLFKYKHLGKCKHL